ncbi:hypothetical protein K437DRAFT_266043 [Tilletiaria anomala UBC 951]|uniref:F-box domain-containing protein n=1 Tax=Tilletiaria anomala (strain ATCC 24038 / CBS 436.72 / UBC 951) TaxID=1037660 RepID=A0A066WR38_TILAU|nr:uncharacterized protein K437DRAFT_266043 [Tilletiaria anomala UBC 951]KDN53110.1 hypothetical protein K437DRAFT_266043 [Tilletiaria anomala UBC 951]
MSVDSLAQLPYEIATGIFSCGLLNAADLELASGVSRAWRQICHDDSMWHKAAWTWKLVKDLDTTLEAVKASFIDENRYFAPARTWREFCIAYEALEKQLGWDAAAQPFRYPDDSLAANHGVEGGGKALFPSICRRFHAANGEIGWGSTHGVFQDLWRMKIIQEDQTIVSTGKGGGIRVTDLRTHELLWSIPPEMTKRFPHLEADNTFIVWDMWAQNSNDQFYVYKAETKYDDPPVSPRRGHYRPYAVLAHEQGIHAYRFKYPYLAAATANQKIVFWDLEAKQKVKILDISPTRLTPFSLTYIDFDDQYLFVTGTGQLDIHIFNRTSEAYLWSMLKYFEKGGKIPSGFQMEFKVPPGASTPGRWFERLAKTSIGGDALGASLRPSGVNVRTRDTPPERLRHRWLEFFNMGQRLHDIRGWEAIHMCEETNTLLIVSEMVLFVLRDYKKTCIDPNYKPEMLVFFLRDPWRSLHTPRIQRQFQEDDFLPTALSVCSGRALWYSQKPYLVDFKHARELKDIKVYLLDQLTQEEQLGHLDMQPRDAICDYKLSQLPGPHYRTGPHQCSCVVLTNTAAYMVEEQYIAPTFHGGRDSIRGCSGPVADGVWSYTHVRCYDWGRSALERVDPARCMEELARFKQPPKYEGPMPFEDTPSSAQIQAFYRQT